MNAGIRRFRRFGVEDMNVCARTLFAAETELLNISVAGACLKATQSLQTTHQQIVRLDSENKPLTLPCSVVWEHAIDNAARSAEKSVPVYKAGVSFEHLQPDKVVRLKDFIRRSAVPYEQKVSDSYKPSLLRFHVHTNNKAVMYYTRTLHVKKIGLGGMLVELRCDIRRGKIVLIELFLPNENPPIRSRGRTASSIPVPGGESGRFNTGIEFLDMATADKFRLSRFLLFSKVPDRE